MLPTGFTQNVFIVNVVRAAILVIIAGLLEIGVSTGTLDPVFFSSPSQIWIAFATLVKNGQLQLNAWTTFYEVLLGFTVGSILGTACGLLLSRLPFTARVVVPFVIMIYGLPSIVLAPLFILWFGIGVLSKIAISVYVIFFSVFIAVYLAASSIDREMIDVVRSMGASRRQIFFKVVVPATAPNIYSALKVGIGLALIGAIAGEFIAAKAGLGYMIFYATGTLDTPAVFVGIIVLALFSIVLQGAVNLLGRGLVRWQFHDEK
jgi:NitT/TauT family transport system permease protein